MNEAAELFSDLNLTDPQKKIINIEREKITVRTGEDEGDGGIVDIATTLSTYRFPASDADRFITDG